MASVLVFGLRRADLAHTQFAEAVCATIRSSITKHAWGLNGVVLTINIGERGEGGHGTLPPTIGSGACVMDILTEAEHLAKAEEYEERARTARYTDIAQGYRTIAESHRTMARLEALRARLLGDPTVPR
jgi:hypothetical protein